MDQSFHPSASESSMFGTAAPAVQNTANDFNSWFIDDASWFGNDMFHVGSSHDLDFDVFERALHTQVFDEPRIQPTSSGQPASGQQQISDDEDPEVASLWQMEQPNEADKQRKRHVESAELSPAPADPKKRRGGRRPALDWESQKRTIVDLYINQDMTLDATMQKMADKGFNASKRKFNAMLKQWNLAKNLTSSNARFMRKKVEQRRDGFNKDTEFLLMKRPIPKDKYMRSTPTDDGYGKAVVPNETPPGMICYTPPDFQPPETSVGRYKALEDPLQLTWEGLDVDALVQLSKKAEALAKDGQITEFLDIFTRSLDGLETLLGVTHVIAQRAMNTFIDVATELGLHEDVQRRLEELVNKHLGRFGQSHPRSIELMAKLGELFYEDNKKPKAEIVLMRLKEGVESLSELNDMEKYKKLWDPLLRLYLIHLDNADFLQARSLLRTWMGQVEALGPKYKNSFMHLKDMASLILISIVSFFRDNDREQPTNPKSLLELVEILEWSEKHAIEYLEWAFVENSKKVCVATYRLLCLLLRRNHDQASLDKLRLLCRITENVLNTKLECCTTCGDKNDPESRMCVMTHLCDRLMDQERFEEAGSWRRQMQEEIDGDETEGPNSRASFNACILLMVCYMKSQRWEMAEPVLKEAQEKARNLFNAENPIHDRIQNCLQSHSWSTCCLGCWASDLPGHEYPDDYKFKEWTVTC